ncbi:PAS domain S-box protein [Chloroflexota bacterium]
MIIPLAVFQINDGANEIAVHKITTRLWFSIGALLLILAITFGICQWQAQRTIIRLDHLTRVEWSVERSVWEMQSSNADIARFVLSYVNDNNPLDIEQLRNAETSFSIAYSRFDRLAESDTGKVQSKEIISLYISLRNSANNLTSLANQQQSEYLFIREKIADARILVDGMIKAIAEDSPNNSVEKLKITLDMRHSLDTINNDVESYMVQPDDRLRQGILGLEDNFQKLSSLFQNSTLSTLEKNWVSQAETRFGEISISGIALFTTSDNMNAALNQFNDLSLSMKIMLTEQIQPAITDEIYTSTENLKYSASSASTGIIALIIIGLLAAIGIIFAVSRRITRPMRALMDGAGIVASGRIEHRFNADEKSEIGQLALSLNKMLDNLKRSRDALAESEELAWTLLDATHDAVVLTDSKGLILASNEIAASRFNRSLEQMIDESIYEMLPEESSASLKAHVTELLRTSKPVHYEDERGGNIIEHDIYPVPDHRGEISRLAVFSRDVTMRKWVEDVTDQLGRRNALILESAGEGIFGLDIEGRTTFVNPAGARMLGYKPEELTSKKHHDIVHHSRPDGKFYPHEECPIYATFKDGVIRSNVDNEVFWRKDGTSFPVEYTSTPIKQDGKILGAVVTFRDINNRARVEKALRESEEKYRSLVESSASLILWVDDRGIVTDSNPRIEQFLGYARKEITGLPLLNFIHPDDRAKTESVLQEVKNKGFAYDYRFRLNTRTGISIAVAMNAAVLRETGEMHSRIICMISNISS